MRLQGQTAIVTGAARGIGLACAERLAQEGAHVVLVDLDAEAGGSSSDELHDRGLSVSFEHCDVSIQSDISEVVARSTRAHGPATVLVNNAGVHQAQDFFEITARDFRRILSINVDSAFNFTQAVARTLVAAKLGGSIINLSSVNSRMASPTAVAYASSKGAISALTAASALALAGHGIRVNAIAPGTIDTDLTARAQSDPAQLDTILQRTPLGRLGRPEEVASVAAFLASSDASYVTGQTIFVEGGRMALSFSMPVKSG